VGSNPTSSAEHISNSSKQAVNPRSMLALECHPFEAAVTFDRGIFRTERRSRP
jgi:hypothetical protein